MKYKFVLFNKAPISNEEASRLSNQLTLELGGDEWKLVNVTPIQTQVNNLPGLLLSFQKEENI